MERLNLDEVWFIPANTSPHKLDAPPVDPTHRMRMLSLMLEGRRGFKVLDIELKKQPPSYTIDTLRQLKQHYPHFDFYLIMGDDAVQGFLRWKDPEEIVKLARLAIVRRGALEDISFLQSSPQVLAAVKNGYLKTSLYPASSTSIRKLVREKGDFSRFLTPEVSEYIRHHNLYSGIEVKPRD
ncbi:Putative nicotinate-nucleotide adenylyltransferase [Estrella lausannensis]|uniref:nicotinate-nucleotide adenylyltransferase n=2 Tax=Estrella lausannensis TaxID=483423 RepID=A0A0H5E5J7_9BACT|nr:Putative nicotinate-nucleotide adenylyltransferase [Estrella lausannensis]